MFSQGPLPPTATLGTRSLMPSASIPSAKTVRTSHPLSLRACCLLACTRTRRVQIQIGAILFHRSRLHTGFQRHLAGKCRLASQS